MGKVLNFDDNKERYIRLANDKAEKGDYEGALSLLFDCLNKNMSADVIAEIAGIYSDMGLYELSNKYWFLFMNNVKEQDMSYAYEELGLNYYYLDNIWVATYYFEKKVKVDGFLSRDDIGEEVLDAIKEMTDIKGAYKIAWPLDKVDFSKTISDGRKAIQMGRFNDAIDKFSKVSEGSKDYPTALNELAVAKFINGDIDGAILDSRKLSIIKDNEVSGYCNLSSFYNFKGDKDNAEFYYHKAVEKDMGIVEDDYKLATCSLELSYTENAIKYCERIIKERPYELNIKYLLALAKINMGYYSSAREILFSIYNINRDNIVVKFYLDLAFSLENGEKKWEKYLPLKYQDDLPDKLTKQYKKLLQTYREKDLGEVKKAFKDKKFIDMITWAIIKGDDECVSISSFLLGFSNTKTAEKIMLSMLLSPTVLDSIKRVLLYLLFINEYKGKIGVVVGSFFTKIKPRKLPFKENGEQFLIAYSWCLSRVAFYEIDNYDKVAFATNKVYVKLKNKINEDEYSRDELSALILTLANYSRFSEKEILNMFSVKKNKFDKLKNLYLGKNEKEKK